MASSVVDRHGRPWAVRALSAFRGMLSCQGGGNIPNPDVWAVDVEILALDWRGPLPETYDPPRVGGIPLCVGDEVEFRGMRSTVTADDLAGKTWLKDPFLRLLRFAGEDQDIEEGEGKWTRCPGFSEKREHPSGAAIWQRFTGWSWRCAGGKFFSDETTSLAKAERLALGQPPATRPGDVLTVARSPISTTAAAAPAIVPQTEQARRVQQYAAFRAAVETACPAGFVARTDMVSRPGDEGITAELSRNGRRWREHWAWSSSGAEHQVGGWVARCVAEADREAGERLRRGK